MNTLKPGTRCENLKRIAVSAITEAALDYTPAYQCESPAVRLVTVPEWKIEGGTSEATRHIPMCAVCAEYHKKAGA